MRNGFDTEDEDLLLRSRDESLNLGKTRLLYLRCGICSVSLRSFDANLTVE